MQSITAQILTGSICLPIVPRHGVRRHLISPDADMALPRKKPIAKTENQHNQGLIEARLERTQAAYREVKSGNGTIPGICAALNVSEPTASRYLDDLELAGAICRHGKQGRKIFWRTTE